MIAARLPPLWQTALLLDLDGTLLDIAPTPDSVVVPLDLPVVLRTLRRMLDDAVAIITGRPVETIDTLLGDIPFAVAGEHGAAIRHAPNQHLERPNLPAPPEQWFSVVEALVAANPGALLERKARGFTLHYRAVPRAQTIFRDELTTLVTGSSDFELLPGNMMWEVRPRGANKGTAVAALMERAPFQGRLPVFIGDDVTDEDGIAAAEALGGAGLRVQDLFVDAAGVRAWLAKVAKNAAWVETCR